jgi:predicted  nucleic acid-binding Zn-ribbon protein
MEHERLELRLSEIREKLSALLEERKALHDEAKTKLLNELRNHTKDRGKTLMSEFGRLSIRKTRSSLTVIDEDRAYEAIKNDIPGAVKLLVGLRPVTALELALAESLVENLRTKSDKDLVQVKKSVLVSEIPEGVRPTLDTEAFKYNEPHEEVRIDTGITIKET